MILAMFSMINVMLVVVFGICLLFLFTWLFQWLWNITIPELFNLKAITFWQAFRLLIIAGMLFGGSNWIHFNA
jgi:uncharacterized membrane protein